MPATTMAKRRDLTDVATMALPSTLLELLQSVLQSILQIVVC
jgi:hypothetical protein